jgi:hypothetical protein
MGMHLELNLKKLKTIISNSHQAKHKIITLMLNNHLITLQLKYLKNMIMR